MSTARVAILYPSDPAGSVPSGIDTFIRGILKWSPPDLQYTLFGASSDLAARPLGRETRLMLGDREVSYVPIVSVDPKGKRSRVPLTVRYLWALRECIRRGDLRNFDVFDFHRIEPVCLFTRDARAKNLMVHQDMSVIRDPNSDIMWRHAPWLYEAIERRLMSAVDSVFCVRRSAVERYAKEQPQSPSKFRYFPTWVDSSAFKPCASVEARASRRSELAQRCGAGVEIGSDTKVLAFVGRLDRQKDPLLLIEAFHAAFRTHSNLHLVMIGDGLLRPQIEQEIVTRGLQGRVTLLGVLPSSIICTVLQASDLFVLSSAYEGMPIAVLEALATGLPVVSTNVGELPAVIKDGVNGFISEARTAESFTAALNRALEALPSMRGAPCVDSVQPYQPDAVLGPIFDIHRAGAQRRTTPAALFA